MQPNTPSSGALLLSVLVFSSPSFAVVEAETMVVTASKRDQVLNQIDAAISVKTGEELERAGVRQVGDLEKVFPGLIIRTRGNRAYANISMRGVTSPDFYNPAVQLYVDGVPQDVAAMTQHLVNIERVELLRGPQGTLYGRNAHGGVINIITRKASDEAEGRVGLTLANKMAQSDLQFATPLGDSGFALDLSLRGNLEKGEITDIASGADDIDNSESYRGQVKLHYNGAGPLTGTLDISREKLRSHEELYLRESAFDQLEYDSATQGPRSLLDRDVDSYALNLNYELDGASLSSTTSWQDRDMDRFLIGNNYPEQQQTLAQELRLALPAAERWDAVVGLFYQQADFQRDDPGFPGFFGPSINQVDKTSYALFGEAAYQLREAWDVTFGARWSREKAEIDFARNGGGSFAFQTDDSFSDVSPKLALGWQAAENHRYYLSVSRGFKPGGFNHAVSSASDAIAYDSETSTNVELGWRASWPQQGLSLTSALYFIDASDKQIYVGPLGMQTIRNVGDAESYGLEADLQWQMSDLTRLGFGFNWGKSTFDSARDDLTGQDYSDNRLPYAPDFDLNLRLEHQLQQQILPGDLLLSFTGRYIDELYFNESNSLKQSGYGLIDLAADLSTRQGVDLRLFVDNLSDKRYRTSSFQFGANDVRSTISEGRVVGLSASLQF